MDDAAHPTIWRSWFMTLCALSAIVLLGQVLYLAFLEGSPGISTVPTRVPFVERIVSSPAHSSLHAGDTMNLKAISPATRWCLALSCFRPGQSIMLTVSRNGRSIGASVVVRAPIYYGVSFTSRASWPFWLSVLGAFWMIGFAALIGWRRPGSREARVLAWLLLLLPLGPALYWLVWPSALSTVLYIAGQTCYDVGVALLATYAMSFKPASRVRTLLAWSTYALCAFSAAEVCVWVFATWTAAIDSDSALFSGAATQIASLVLPFIFAVLCGVVAIGEVRGAERTRLSWTMASLGLLYYLLNALRYLVALIAPAHAGVFNMIGDASVFIAPLGLTYALLNRKLLDVGFVLNRAAVFTGVSVVVVGIFVLLEWAFGEWLRDASHTTSVAVSGGLAMVLGLSVRFVHGRVEHVVDNALFRKRHEDEAALRAFAHEAGYITDPQTLLARTLATIERHTDATSAQIAIDDGNGCYGNASVDDAAIVALRAWFKPLDLHGLETALRGDMAFPMIARGRLVGALVLGPKRSAESYAPDESDAIMQAPAVLPLTKSAGSS